MLSSLSFRALHSVKKKTLAAMAPAPANRSYKDPRPIPDVPDLKYDSYNSEDALVQDIIEGLRTAGLCIVRQIIKPDIRAKISSEFRPYTTNLAPTPGDFWPKETRKITSMVSKSETYALHMVGHPVWQKVGQHFMTSTLKDYWVCKASQPPLLPSSKPRALVDTRGGVGSELRGNHNERVEPAAQQHARLHHWPRCPRSRSPPR